MSDEAKPHSSQYLGPFETNFPRDVAKKTYRKRDLVTEMPIAAIDVPGIVFGVLESKSLDAYLWVRVGDIELRAPVLVMHGRHTGHREKDNEGKTFAPSETRLSDENAAAIIVDAIVANAECRDGLGRKLRAIGKP
jgi:hypothetical protein